MANAMFKARTSAAIVAVAAAALLAGCANRDSVTVGSIPDDYRTNHPIVISGKDKVLDLPVLASAQGVSRSQRQALAGFLDDYDTGVAPVLTIATPSGSANERAAGKVAREFSRLARANGVRANRIAMTQYQASPEETSAPVRLVYSSIRAQTGPCGRWPKDILETADNKHYANFGCSYQNNLAAQIANPADLMGPRKQDPIDAENRNKILGDYRSSGNANTPREVNY
ncbi:CpaD family pilus assembly protein [Aquamicrobium segne]|uniref:CpaD family pilus assembly protein n=1 Tax=Aquamicrobium segne TaxID=469547 RepID=A0ABW0GUT5_9HYPH